MMGADEIVLSMDTMMRDLARLQFLLRIVESDCAVFVDDGGRILYVGPGLRDVLGWSATDLVGRPLTTLIPEQYHRLHNKGFRRVVTNKTSFEESKVLYKTIALNGLHRDQTEVPLLISVAAWRSTEGRLYFAGKLERGLP